MRILIVEDNAVLADGLTRSLREADYAVDWAATGTDANAVLENDTYDLVILDLGLPGMDGLDVLKRVRARRCPVPVLILSARDGIEERITGLDLGADDYMVKPFNLRELEARVRTLMRRGQAGSQAVLTHGRVAFDMTSRSVTVNDQALQLSARELGVLEILMLQAGKVVSKERMVEHLYDWNTEATPNAIEVYIHRLRKKLEPAGVTIRTIRGLGYLLEATA
ncbi:MAG: response regulator [Gammaproteobacteria bacterium]|jgi:two-component system, OmpR family, response regulator